MLYSYYYLCLGLKLDPMFLELVQFHTEIPGYCFAFGVKDHILGSKWSIIKITQARFISRMKFYLPKVVRVAQKV